MSHFCMLVCSNNPDKESFDALLAPYGENNEDYFSTHMLSEDDVEQHLTNYKKYYLPTCSGKRKTFEKYMEDCGYQKVGDDWLIDYNDDGIWDWYTLDARNDNFEYRNHKYVENPRLKDYVFQTKPSKKEEERLRKRWENIEGIALGKPGYPAENSKEAMDLIGRYKASYLYDRYVNADQFIKEHSIDSPWCFITPDGVLHEPGRVGWFACDDATAESMNKYLDEWIDYISSDANPYVSFVDCHI